MIDFPIKFVALGNDYTAQVHRIGSVSVQYHVSDVQPADIKIPSPYIFSANQQQQQLDFPIFGYNYSREIGGAISVAIFKACEENGIPVFDETYAG